MPAVEKTNAAPSTLADVLGQVVDAFQAVGDATPVMVGKQYLDRGIGAGGARVLFIPEPKGKLGPPMDMGNSASMTHSCRVLVRGQEDGSDLGRFRTAYSLADRVVGAVRRAAAGRLDFGDMKDGSAVDVDAFGADIDFSFTYQRDVRSDARIWGLAKATSDGSSAVPLVPPTPGPGQAGTIDAVDATTAPPG